MIDTPQQKALFTWMETGQGHGILEAVAGSGKTTSVIEGLNYIDDTVPVLLCSFTNLIAKELDRRVKEQKFYNVTSSTLNSTGWQICKANVRGVELDQYKTSGILKAIISRGNAPCDKIKLANVLNWSICKMVGLLKGYVVIPGEDFQERVDHIADYHSVELPEGTSDEATVARKYFNTVLKEVYLQSISTLQYMDFDDQKFMPVYMGWNFPQYKWVIVDEAQDCNECDIQLISQFLKNGRLLAVGDRKQAIYLFRGALNNAMQVIQERFKAYQMPLTVCWRCPDLVIKEAQKTNPAIQGPVPNNKGDGIVRTSSTEDFIQDCLPGDYVICRSTAPLVKRCLQLIKKGVPSKVKGREIGRSLVHLIDKIAAKTNQHSREALLEFINTVVVYKTDTTQTLEAANREEAAIKIADECDAIIFFCTEAESIASVKEHILSLFTDDGDDSKIVLFLTGHKAKGLQNPRVWFLRPDLCPHPKAKKPHDQEQEKHVRHIVVTRAERELIFISKEKDEK